MTVEQDEIARFSKTMPPAFAAITNKRYDDLRRVSDVNVIIPWPFSDFRWQISSIDRSEPQTATRTRKQRKTGVKITPVHWAVMYDDPKAIKILAQKGAKLNTVDDLGDSPLAYAAMFKHVPAAKALLEAGSQLPAGIFRTALNGADITGSGYESYSYPWSKPQLFPLLTMLLKAGAKPMSFSEIEKDVRDADHTLEIARFVQGVMRGLGKEYPIPLPGSSIPREQFPRKSRGPSRGKKRMFTSTTKKHKPSKRPVALRHPAAMGASVTVTGVAGLLGLATFFSLRR